MITLETQYSHIEFCICFKYFSLLTTNTFLMEVLKHISFSYFSYDNKEERDDNPLWESGEEGREGGREEGGHLASACNY